MSYDPATRADKAKGLLLLSLCLAGILIVGVWFCLAVHGMS